MRESGKLTAAMEILDDFTARRVPLKTAIADWGRQNRYAGAKDRAWIAGLCLDVLRRRTSLATQMGEDSPRALVLGALHYLWQTPLETLGEWAAEEPHGPGALAYDEQTALAQENTLDTDKSGDVPDWVLPLLERAFGDKAAVEARAFGQRASVDLRLNALKATPEKALSALKSVKAKAAPILNNAAQIKAPDPAKKAPAVTVIPAFNKGWVEVQDLGSQIVTAAAGDIGGAQVMDYCAGGGGKTLALSALMNNTGQLYAYDRDARRLKPLYHRAKRAGVRNVQVCNPVDGGVPDDLQGKMDVVFVDAPCTGSGTWRRHPDTKWRLTEQQLERRLREQDTVLTEAAPFVRPGGHLLYVTCSVFMEENEDRLAAFLETHKDFQFAPALQNMEKSGLLAEDGKVALQACETPDGALRLSPARIGTDGFFVALLEREA
ncbi:MAG: RsmB/NOP family class I SAM-dependent RNA methyltransferase [Robiginitomaculum sp.]|nr:RsmB/NOP family class I SAM-dependent RNA methyltransferase [Robiginitomaculum sp.]MDQ7077416.1 RsmB/NOP family class I SAM-dependent RNA methyltransferase [Robiginitomaculum sp.]